VHSIVAAFWQCVHQHPDGIALIDSSGDTLVEYSWRELGGWVARLADHLQCSTRRGAHVAAWLPNSLQWIVLDLAAQSIGRVHVPLDRRIPVQSVWELSRHAQAELLVVPAHQVLSVAQARPAGVSTTVSDVAAWVVPNAAGSLADMPRPSRIASDEVAQILYTSGTMSQPKGVMLTHGNLVSNALAKLDAAPQFPDDVRLNVLPFAHAYARTCELSTWILSRSRLCLAKDWNQWLALAPRVHPTLVNLVPHLISKLVNALQQARQAGLDPAAVVGDRLRLLQVGGAALRKTDWDYLAAAGWPPLQGYGLTEASPVVCSNRTGLQCALTVGPAVQGVQLKLDEQGVLWTRGPHVMTGYWNTPSETSQKIVDGWLCTGDLAEQTAEGHWRILGRADDQITLSTGYKADPHELLQRLSADPWVDQLVIVGQDRPYLSALIWPKWENLPAEFRPPEPSLARQSSSGDAPDVQWLKWTRTLLARWQTSFVDLPRQLHIQRVGLLASPLTVAGGELNFKGAIRRKIIEHQLRAAEVEALYAPQELVSQMSREQAS